ncbi:hypothetical protein FRC02_008919 [Tulasnella sp. 418]|nr:hypothetical protein FRC02_008919 [Tulasnella sp. 418]
MLRSSDLIITVTQDMQEMRFVEFPTSHAWDRFMSLSARVKSLALDDSRCRPGPPYEYPLSDKVYNRIALQRPAHREMFPTLRSLNWTYSRRATLQFLPLFISSQLRHLEIHTSSSDAPAEPIRAVLNHIPFLNNSLTSVVLDLNRVAASDVEDSVVRFLDDLKRLSSFQLPHCYFTTKIVDALGRHDGLTEIKAWSRHEYQAVDLYGAKMVFRDGMFNRLEFLRFDASMEQAISLVQSRHRPPMLSKISLSTLSQPTQPEQLRMFLGALSEAYPNLTLLALNLWRPMDGEVDQNNRQLTFNYLRPILTCKKINTFHIGHPLPLNINEEQLGEMIKAWPDLKELSLCEDPYVSSSGDVPTGLPLSVLPMFTTCRQLELICLYMDTSSIGAYVRGEKPFPNPPLSALPRLERLDLGLSPVRCEEYDAAAFFAELLGEKCKLVSGPTEWHTAVSGTELEASNRNSFWDGVKTLTERLRRFRQGMTR